MATASEPRFLSDGVLYNCQVREATEYAMFTLSPAGILMTWNAGVWQLLGYSEEEWLGQPAAIIFTPVEKAVEICAAERTLAADAGSSSDTRWHRRKDGSEMFAHGIMTSIRGGDGMLLGFAKIISDETTNKVLQDALVESNMALEQFAHVASHDLQEPLRTAAAFADLLASPPKPGLESEVADAPGLIVDAMKRMRSLVQDLLLFAQVKTEVNRPSSYSLDETLESALTQLHQRIEESKGSVTHGPLPKILGDQGQMVRLFENLVGNSLKYRKPDVPPVIHVSAQQQGSSWVITVRDNGIGFDPKYATEIFLPFKRLHSRDAYAGTGVGLAICRRIVEGHGGRIWAESQLGQGASFHFSLPVGGKAPPRYTKPVTAGL
jgi:PAS domain S-box-containing protein